MLMTKQDVADRFQVSLSTIKRWVKAGKLKTVRLSPTIVRFRLAEVIKLEERSSH